jgi:hypothetical protein
MMLRSFLDESLAGGGCAEATPTQSATVRVSEIILDRRRHITVILIGFS